MILVSVYSRHFFIKFHSSIGELMNLLVSSNVFIGLAYILLTIVYLRAIYMVLTFWHATIFDDKFMMGVILCKSN